MSHAFAPLMSPRLVLRRFGDDDLEAFFAYRADPANAKYQGWREYKREDAQRLVAQQHRVMPGGLGTRGQIAIERRDTGEMIGDVFLNCFEDEPTHARIGYTLARAQQGQGFATEAVALLLDYLFGPLEKRRVTALTYADNLRSVALLERLGLRREAHHVGSSQLGADWVDDYVYAMLAHEWVARERS